jgi:hypothetical protein
LNLRRTFGHALGVLCYGIAAGLAAICLADIYYRCRWEIFFPDEVYNLDPILTFFRTGDYTSVSQGNHPFDPVLSSGILATWLNGLVYVIGGTLYRERLASALVQFGLVTYFAYRLLRSRGVVARDALVVALGAWTALILAGCHYLRIINAGELWGFVYLVAGCSFAERAPRLAAFVWGLGTWLAKITFLPFSGALLAALALAESLRPVTGANSTFVGRLLVNSARLGFAFVAPLLLWMALIVVRYDFATLEHWMSSYVTFVAKHAADVRIADLPVYENWRFDPPWTDVPLLSFGWPVTARYVGPLVVGAAAVVIYALLRVAGVVRSTLTETCLLVGASAAGAAAVTWFFTLDPTQWGRHLMPSIYVSVFVALYCVSEIYRTLAARPIVAAFIWVLAYAAVLTGAYYAYGVTRDYAASNYWRLSYAQACRGSNVLLPPCQNNDTLDLVEKLGKEWCGPDTHMFSPTDYCKGNNRKRIVEHAVDILADANAPERLVHTGGYLLTLIQVYDYENRESFMDDFAPIVCGRPADPLHARLRTLGVDEKTLAEVCTPRPSQSAAGAPAPGATPQ